MAGDRPPDTNYAEARRLIAIGLAVVFGALLLYDAANTTYSVDPVIAGAILGSVAVLLGVDIGNRIGRGGA